MGRLGPMINRPTSYSNEYPCIHLHQSIMFTYAFGCSSVHLILFNHKYVSCVCLCCIRLSHCIYNTIKYNYGYKICINCIDATGARGMDHPLFLTFCLQIYFQ